MSINDMYANQSLLNQVESLVSDYMTLLLWHPFRS